MLTTRFIRGRPREELHQELPYNAFTMLRTPSAMSIVQKTLLLFLKITKTQPRKCLFELICTARKELMKWQQYFSFPFQASLVKKFLLLSTIIQWNYLDSNVPNSGCLISIWCYNWLNYFNETFWCPIISKLTLIYFWRCYLQFLSKTILSSILLRLLEKHNALWLPFSSPPSYFLLQLFQNMEEFRAKIISQAIKQLVYSILSSYIMKFFWPILSLNKLQWRGIPQGLFDKCSHLFNCISLK